MGNYRHDPLRVHFSNDELGYFSLNMIVDRTGNGKNYGEHLSIAIPDDEMDRYIFQIAELRDFEVLSRVQEMRRRRDIQIEEYGSMIARSILRVIHEKERFEERLHDAMDRKRSAE